MADNQQDDNYDVNDIQALKWAVHNPQDPKVPAILQKLELDPQDFQAIQWAGTNAYDPRAEQIMKQNDLSLSSVFTPQEIDNPPAGAEVPVEQRLANNIEAVGQGAMTASALGDLGALTAAKAIPATVEKVGQAIAKLGDVFGTAPEEVLNILRTNPQQLAKSAELAENVVASVNSISSGLALQLEKVSNPTVNLARKLLADSPTTFFTNLSKALDNLGPDLANAVNTTKGIAATDPIVNDFAFLKVAKDMLGNPVALRNLLPLGAQALGFVLHGILGPIGIGIDVIISALRSPWELGLIEKFLGGVGRVAEAVEPATYSIPASGNILGASGVIPSALRYAGIKAVSNQPNVTTQGYQQGMNNSTNYGQ